MGVLVSLMQQWVLISSNSALNLDFCFKETLENSLFNAIWAEYACAKN